MGKNIHVIVATGVWGQDHLKYRRHRLAEYLLDHPDTEDVIWVCPSPSGAKDEEFTTLENGIKQYVVSDIHPNKLFRFGRYYDLFYKGKLHKLKVLLEESKNKNDLFLWYTFPGFPGVAEIVSWNKITYDCSDLWASSISGDKNIILLMREKSILQAERRIVKKANKITCSSDYLYNNISNLYKVTGNVYVFENGVEYELFEHIPNVVEEEKMNNDKVVLGFIGGLKPKLDFRLLQLVMEKKKHWQLLLVGPDGTNGDPKFEHLSGMENVTWTDKVPPSEVPKYMEKITIGVLPYKESEYNNAVFPLKLFEFLGAGKPVVGLNLPSTEKFKEKDVYHYVSSDHDEDFIRECEALMVNVKNSSLVDKRKKIAKEKDWNNIFFNMYQVIMS